jgi:hypothetical protein
MLERRRRCWHLLTMTMAAAAAAAAAAALVEAAAWVAGKRRIGAAHHPCWQLLTRPSLRHLQTQQQMTTKETPHRETT